MPIMKSGFISEFPNSIKSFFNQKSGEACTLSVCAGPLEKEDGNAAREKCHTKKSRQKRREVCPNGLHAGAIKETVVDCFLSRARRTAIGVNVTPIFQCNANLNRA